MPPRAAIATAHAQATEAGVRTLAAGGNAVDAAAAAAWALCVCEPSGSGLGGQTVLILRQGSGSLVVIDGHSRAPRAASKTTVSRAQQHLGYRATTVPTTPLTLAHVQERYGNLPLRGALEPALELAAEGYEISPLQSRQLRWCRTHLLASPATSDFLNGRRAYRPGEVFRQPRLAACLERLAEHGVRDFYDGGVARAIAGDMERHDGLLTLADLQEAAPPEEKPALAARYRGRLVLSAPPPAGGAQLLYALQTLEQFDANLWREQPDEWYGDVADAVHGAFVERERTHRPLALSGVGSERGGETTHLVTADDQGNVVSLTQSIQSLFGAKVANEQYGFLYNNYLTTCPRRHRHVHCLSPGCPARSNAAPTLVLSDEQDGPTLALGAAGSRRIISALVQVASAVMDLGLSLEDALSLPRVHPRLKGSAWLERPAASASLLTNLSESFGDVELRPEHSYGMGAVQALEITGETSVSAAADPRRDGTAWTS